MRARKRPNYDAVCFHAQQCAAKYLKAILQEHVSPFGRTHDLLLLVTQVEAIDPSWALARPALAILTQYAIDVRYPGASAARTDARDAVRACCDVRSAARVSLALPP